MTKRLTKKQKGFVKDYIKTGNGTQAALNNYNVKNEHTAAVIASENLTKPEIVNSIQEAIPDTLLAERHLELLNTRNEYNWYENVYEDTKDKKGKKEVIEVKRHTIDLGVDVIAVSKGLDLAYKLKGSYAAEKHINLNIEVETSPEVKELTEKLNGIYRGSSNGSDGGTTSPLGTEAQD